MSRKLIELEAFRAALKAGTKPEDGVMRAAAGEPEVLGGRVVRFVFSDGSVDRVGDTIDPKGWELDAFNENPVALWAHCSWDLPIGRATNVHVQGRKLVGDIEFAEPETYPFADTVFRMVKAGYLNAVSVGFVPLEYAFVQSNDRPFGIDFKRQELLEISVVPVPANANALVEARAAGIDVAPIVGWAEKVLAGGNGLLVPKAGRRISKATREVLEKALEHHCAMGDCIKGLLDGDAPDPEPDDDEKAAAAVAAHAREVRVRTAKALRFLA